MKIDSCFALNIPSDGTDCNYASSIRSNSSEKPESEHQIISFHDLTGKIESFGTSISIIATGEIDTKSSAIDTTQFPYEDSERISVPSRDILSEKSTLYDERTSLDDKCSNEIRSTQSFGSMENIPRKITRDNPSVLGDSPIDSSSNRFNFFDSDEIRQGRINRTLDVLQQDPCQAAEDVLPSKKEFDSADTLTTPESEPEPADIFSFELNQNASKEVIAPENDLLFGQAVKEATGGIVQSTEDKIIIPSLLSSSESDPADSLSVGLRRKISHIINETFEDAIDNLQDSTGQITPSLVDSGFKKSSNLFDTLEAPLYPPRISTPFVDSSYLNYTNDVEDDTISDYSTNGFDEPEISPFVERKLTPIPEVSIEDEIRGEIDREFDEFNTNKSDSRSSKDENQRNTDPFEFEFKNLIDSTADDSPMQIQWNLPPVTSHGKTEFSSTSRVSDDRNKNSPSFSAASSDTYYSDTDFTDDEDLISFYDAFGKFKRTGNSFSINVKGKCKHKKIGQKKRSKQS